MKKTVLIVGGGGREHAFAWKLSCSDAVGRILVAPGNAGTATTPRCENVAISDSDVTALVDLAVEQSVSLVLVGPEAPIAAGIRESMEAAGIACFAPTAIAAKLESSKRYAKDFMQNNGIPTAKYASFTDRDEAFAFLDANPGDWVIKADGLAAGKGVVVANDMAEARDAVASMFDGQFGAAGTEIVIEERLIGEEASYICMVDGDDILPLASSQDHKARDSGGFGPNTGGMGAYSPAPVLTETLEAKVLEDVIRPVIDGLKAEGVAFRGFLYAGLMIDPFEKMRVLEFNCRCGDPETQPILMRLESDFYALLEAACANRLGEMQARWSPSVALGVVIAAGGYPGTVRRGDVIEGLDSYQGPRHLQVFHAGTTTNEQGQVVTAGGRVLCVTALGETIFRAAHHAYVKVDEISWPGSFYRDDIGAKSIQREQQMQLAAEHGPAH
ncbi:phosphoribosylamine--glycine ligase [Gammaproteobacteria bacterium]|nr:phosphoribosylamine--glycine ligase [Gammaproteobacteria bacterium]